MAKSKTIFVCQNCGNTSVKWLGKCPECGAWDSYVEEFNTPQAKTFSGAIELKKLRDIDLTQENRIKTGIAELDNVLGSGIVQGSLILVGGDPGIGKSTLLLQVALNVSSQSQVLYVSGEESLKQIKLRAQRLGIESEKIDLMSETALENILVAIEQVKPKVMIIDSIQTVTKEAITSAAGSVSQVREVTNGLMKVSKKKGIATFIVGHVTKSGAIAGPKVLEHIVDTVLYFEGDKNGLFRILRSVKNRFGSTNEVGLFEMSSRGLLEVTNPSEIFLQQTNVSEPGSVIFPSVEGTRPLLVEVQSLVSNSGFATSRRMGLGVDYNKLVMLIAVLEKKLSLVLSNEDVYVNIVGGIQISEPALDLAIIASIASSFFNKKISKEMVILGEVGLLGEIRSVPQVEKRLMEAKRMGFTRALIPKNSLEDRKALKGLEIAEANSVRQAFEILF
ncbi:MAG: DNA repair protein RadA [delta proteobacterium ML8_F1]|nr:MAG: DNA repair protein RadA [delta proteobacterium ML8_F1]